MKQDYTFKSTDGQNMIHAVKWIPEGEVVATLQLCHGMIEYIDRYGDFATWLNEKGIAVYGHDHLGHGYSVSTLDDYGYFGKSGNDMLVGDVHKVREIAFADYPDAPHFILGHSMGSFIVREYITQIDKEIDKLAGAIVMGTGRYNKAMLVSGLGLSGALGAFKGEHYRSQLVTNLVIGISNKNGEVTNVDINRKIDSNDPDEIGKNQSEKGFQFTVNGHYNLFKAIYHACDKKAMSDIPEGFPLFLISGGDDPIGGRGEAVRKTYSDYLNYSKARVDIEIYEGQKHEILMNDIKEQVYEDIYTWLCENI